jgi:hypothetical protein
MNTALLRKLLIAGAAVGALSVAACNKPADKADAANTASTSANTAAAAADTAQSAAATAADAAADANKAAATAPAAASTAVTPPAAPEKK